MKSEEIDKLAAFCSRTPGAKAALRRMFAEKHGMKVNRENFARWLHKNPEKRNSPRFQVGRILIACGEELMRQGL